MRRSLLCLLAALLAVAAVLAWRLWPTRQPTPADDESLSSLPHVASIEGEAKGRHERVVVHLLDRHLVPRNLFDQDASASAGKKLSQEELDPLYAQHLDAVEAVQEQLEAILRQLAVRNANVPVYVEGLSDSRDANVFRLKATGLSDAAATQIAEARSLLPELKKRKGRDAADVAKQCEALIARHRSEWLELGAVAGPCAEGLVEVRPLEDAEALRAAEPRWMGGELFDPEAVKAREDAMARRVAAAKEPFVVVLLGGAHDLREALAKHAPRARYVRVTTEAYGAASGRK